MVRHIKNISAGFTGYFKTYSVSYCKYQHKITCHILLIQTWQTFLDIMQVYSHVLLLNKINNNILYILRILEVVLVLFTITIMLNDSFPLPHNSEVLDQQ